MGVLALPEDVSPNAECRVSGSAVAFAYHQSRILARCSCVHFEARAKESSPG